MPGHTRDMGKEGRTLRAWVAFSLSRKQEKTFAQMSSLESPGKGWHQNCLEHLVDIPSSLFLQREECREIWISSATSSSGCPWQVPASCSSLPWWSPSCCANVRLPTALSRSISVLSPALPSGTWMFWQPGEAAEDQNTANARQRTLLKSVSVF